MFDTLLSYVAPHPCCSCGELGAVLCDNCKYDIVDAAYGKCVVCHDVTMRTGVCDRCHPPYVKAWCVGEREGVLQRLIGVYKFNGAVAARTDIARLLDSCVDQLPINTIIVPVPTVSAHIRERSFDHTYEVTKLFAKSRGLLLSRVLRRRTATKQRSAGYIDRVSQAKAAFEVTGKVPAAPHLLVDDVMTTGATLHFAAKSLIDAGASEVWVAVVARQVLD